MVKYEDYIEIIKIDNYNQLIEKLQGNKPKFRQNYIFRGLGSTNYELIPSALRKDNNGRYILNNYIDSKFCVYETTSASNHFKRCIMSYEDYEKSNKKETPLLLDKNGKKHEDKTSALCWVSSEKELQFKRELYVLLKFFNLVDKSGLKISATPEIRRLVHENINFKPPQNKWPSNDFFEIISLAQHYGLPTQAMDWSYDFKSALYFATRNILQGNDDDCVLWAFNYKLFEDSYNPNHNFPYKLQFYRPEYNSNQNLKGQKGLFTFIISEDYNFDNRPLNNIIIEDVMNNIEYKAKNVNYVRIYGLNDFIIPSDEKIFYKFIIPNELKHEILKELYLDGYCEENLFPGYLGVVQGIENRVKLEDYERGLSTDKKTDILMSFNEKEIENIFNINKRIIFRKSFDYGGIDKVFIYSKSSGRILGYFKVYEIVKNAPENIWNTFRANSTLSKEDFFKYFENISEGYAIFISDLIKFQYPISLDLGEDLEYYQIDCKNKNLNFLLNFK